VPSWASDRLRYGASVIPETRKRFERLIVATTTARQKVLDHAADEEGVSLPSLLVTKYACDKTRILQILAEVYRVPAVDLTVEPMETALLKEAPMKLWRQALAVPLRLEDGHVLVAFADPEDLAAVDEVRAVLGHPVTVLVGLAHEIQEFLDDWGGRVSVGSLVSDLVQEESAATARPQLPDGPRLRVTSWSEAVSPAVRLIDNLVTEAVMRRASEIYLVPFPDGVTRARMKLKRKIVESKAYDGDLHVKVVNRLRVLADLVGKDKRVPQSGAFLTLVQEKKHRVDVMILPTAAGEAVTLFLDQESKAQQEGEAAGAEFGP